ncbi:MAG: RHS repeat-associated core domain-containing protein, partial [Hahellaceae bacterium]|nr:RHS repeat-associated core domain-containing protein [Hahellaceae bacterium]
MYAWDAVGNLETFDDVVQGVSEAYTYDDLYRLNDVVASNGINSSIRYDDLGNILSKSGVGSYAYNEIAVPSECGANNSAPGPHALRRITGTKANYFCYDANGNLVKDNSRQLQYSAFNIPTQITKGSTVVKFDYGPERNRFKREDSSGGSSTTTYTIGDYERVKEGSVTKHKITIAGVAQVIKTDGQSFTDINYFLKDHLGSLTAIVNKYGTVLENMSYDAWGSRRLTNLTLLANPYSYQNGITHRGFTGHEQVDSVGLIHMNGRVYDPIIGRFLSADPFVQAPSNLQNLNRYSYVMNNPLSMTDPSGFNWWKEVRRVASTVVGAIVGAVVGAVAGCIAGIGGGPYGCIAGGAAGAYYGFFAGAAFGYSYRYAKDKGIKHHDALDGAAKAGATSLVTSYASNLAGTWLDSVNYGNSVVAEGVTRVTTHALIGGTMAKVNGGKFADGAFVSGFRELYSFGFALNTPKGSLVEYGFFSYAENAPLAILEQAAVSAAASKIAGVSSSDAFRATIANAVLASIFNGASHRKFRDVKRDEIDRHAPHSLGENYFAR